MKSKFLLAISALAVTCITVEAMNSRFWADENEVASWSRAPRTINDMDPEEIKGYVIAYIEQGNLKQVKELVPAKVSPDAKSSNGYSLLAIAEFRKQNAIADYLRSLLNK